jgi:hypothetical protein
MVDQQICCRLLICNNRPIDSISIAHHFILDVGARDPLAALRSASAGAEPDAAKSLSSSGSNAESDAWHSSEADFDSQQGSH